jgi:hypothetical protein
MQLEVDSDAIVGAFETVTGGFVVVRLVGGVVAAGAVELYFLEPPPLMLLQPRAAPRQRMTPTTAPRARMFIFETLPEGAHWTGRKPLHEVNSRKCLW